jgi:hypothetical protein
MASLQYCIYRNKSNLGICNCKKTLNSVKFCIKHTDNDINMVKLYEAIYDVVKYKRNLDLHDYYLIFKSIEEKQFINMLVNLSKSKFVSIFDKYLLEKNKRKGIY